MPFRIRDGCCWWPVQQEFHVKSFVADKAVNEFTLSSRSWAVYGADKIEMMLRHGGYITDEMQYARFDNSSDELVFKINAATKADRIESLFYLTIMQRDSTVQEGEYEVIEDKKELPSPPKQLKP